VSDYLYLYGFVPHDTSQPPRALSGINDAALELIPVGGLQAVISRVPADKYAPDQVETRLQDLDWVAQQGAAHERVVAWFVDHAQILPVSLLTMYSTRQALEDAYFEQEQHLLETMQRLHGLREWDLKVSFDEQQLLQHAASISERVAELDREIAAAPAGKGYLLQKKRADVVRTEVRQAAHRRAVAVLNNTRTLAVETRNLPLPRAAESLPVVLHAALLVHTQHEGTLVEMLQAEAGQLRTVGMEVSFSGPWAPYRFIGEHE
jgi:hypothetical protein